MTYLLKHKFLLLILSIFFVSLLIEGLARIGSTIYADFNYIKKIRENKSREWQAYTPELGWERKPGFRGEITFRAGITGNPQEFDSKGFRSADTSQINDTSKRKVIFLGDSITFGIAVPMSLSFVEQLEGLLPDINFINLGVIGYSSYQGYKVLEKVGIPMEPDIVIVGFNFNDRRYVFHEDNMDSVSKFRKLSDQLSETYNKKQVRDILEIVYIYRGIKKLMEISGLAEIEEPRKEVNVNDLRPRVSPEDYRENLRRIVELAKSKGVQVIFLSFNDNPVESDYIRKGIKYFEESQYDLSISHLSMNLHSKGTMSYNTLARIYLSKAYERIGHFDEAKNVLVLEDWINSAIGGSPLYLDTEYGKIMREVANEYNVEVVDCGKVLDEDPSVYVDAVHLNASGHRKVANLLSKHIAEALSSTDR